MNKLITQIRIKPWKQKTLEERGHVMIKSLIISSILFILSVLSCSYKILGFGTIQYIIIILLNISHMCLRSNIKTQDIVNHTNKRSEYFLKNKNYIRGTVYSLAIPSVVTGVLFLSGLIILLFTI